MKTKRSTEDKILEAGRALFNSKGYAATSLADIAHTVGVSKGNLSYYFPTKRDIALRLRDNTRKLTLERRRNYVIGDIAVDYVEHLLFAMNIAWHNRFLLRDSAEFLEDEGASNSELSADFAELSSLIHRIGEAGMFRRNTVDDIATLTRSIWIVSRYWMDYLRESEGQSEVCWADQERGIKHHFAVLLPCLTAPAKRKFEAALARAPRESVRIDA